MFKQFGLFFIFLSFIYTPPVQAKVPEDFRFEYENRAGRLAKGTVEKIVVTPGLVTVTRDAKHIGEGPEMKHTVRTYRPTSEQMEKLIQIIESSGFLTWPPSAKIPHKSQADEYIQITLNGKTARHTKWEKAHQESFRILWVRFNDWFTDLRSVRL